jgi:NAD(P)-dependent dehydrogenase (short-subunit alcohol dehydrogenase family)
MAVNATGVFFGIKYAVPAMVANGGGSIVNLSSIAGIIGSEYVHMAYNASKAAVRLMTKSVAVQHAKDKIRANSVHPGIMPPMRTSDPAVRAERMRVMPMRRPCRCRILRDKQHCRIPEGKRRTARRKSLRERELRPQRCPHWPDRR